MTPLNASNRIDTFEMPLTRGRIGHRHTNPRLDEPQSGDGYAGGTPTSFIEAQPALSEPTGVSASPLKTEPALSSTIAAVPSERGPDAFAIPTQLIGTTSFAGKTNHLYQPISFDLSQAMSPQPSPGELDPLLGSLAALSKMQLAPEIKTEAFESSAVYGLSNSAQTALDQQKAVVETLKPQQEPVAYGLGNFAHLALDKQKAIAEMMKAQYATFPPNLYHGLNNFVRRVLDRQKAVSEMMRIQQGMSAAPETTRQVTCAGLNQEEVITGVFKALKALGVNQAHFCVDEQIFSKLDKLKLDPVEFFTARACWQGVASKRRATLEGVLDQFPALPKDRKNWQSAVESAQAKGVEVTEADKVFIRYFMENRKAMKTLFRATLLSGFEGKTATCYRGQLAAENNTTRSLGCYSFNPNTANIWGSREGSNVKRFRVNVNDIWSTYTVTQNSRRCERELTVYSRNGVREGKEVTDQVAAGKLFWARYEKDLAAQETERMAWGWSVAAELDG